MAITRRWQSGFELQTTEEFSSISNIAISNTKAKTGSYSARINTDYYGLVDITETAQVRLACHINHVGTTVDSAVICELRSGATSVLSLRLNDVGNLLELWDNLAVIDSVALGDLGVENTWHHLSLDAKIDAAGWAAVRLNGTLVINFSGDTNDGAATINKVLFGGDAGSGIWAPYLYVDDAYVDDTTGEAAPSTPPDLRYHLLTPNGNGSQSQWDGNDGNQVDNYLLVDDIPHDTDTTYVLTDVDGEQDSYALTTYALAAGESFVSVIAYGYLRKEDGASAAQAKLYLGDGALISSGTLQDLGTSYTLKLERFLLAPDGGAWGQADIDALEVGVEINI